jgi:uncharacterized protein (TIGR02145 family)
MKKHHFRLHSVITAAAIMLTGMFTQTLTAQVRIGGDEAPALGALLDLNSSSRGGLLFSNVSITSMDSIPVNSTVFPGLVQGSPATDVNLPLKGMVVYNINPDTGEGLYVWDGDRWKVVNGGSVVIKGGAGNCDPFAADGSCENVYEVADPSCREEGDYVFTWISGGGFIDRLLVIDAGSGKFSVRFLDNDRASSRSAILLVSSPCGNSNTFVFTQEGDQTGCTGLTTLSIRSGNAGNTFEMCQGGAVYLYLDGYPTASDYVWTLNGDQVGTGNTLIATKPGKYTVYENKIGCPNSASATVTLGGSAAPAPVQFIVVGNNGVICSAGGTAELVVTQPVSGDIAWYRDGRKAAAGSDYTLNGGSWDILAKAGSWQAAVEDGGCASTPAGPVSLTEQGGSSQIPTPVMIVNGKDSSPYALCQGGSMLLEVQSPDPSHTYTWYIDNTQIGTGTSLYYPVPGNSTFVLRLRATGSGCAGEAISITSVLAEAVPQPPVISVNTGNALCGGQATLTASGGTTYIWYKDDNVIQGKASASLTVTETGSYSVSAVSGNGCASQRSAARDIVASDYATVSWVSHPDIATEGQVKTYSVSVDYPIGAVYNWSIIHKNGSSGSITNGQGTPAITVSFPASGTDTVVCSVSTACGSALGSPLKQEVVVSPGCSNAVITSGQPLVSYVKVNQSANLPTLSVNAAGSPLVYQWYKGASGVTAAPIASATGNSYTVPASDLAAANTTLQYWCKVTATGCNEVHSSTFTVYVETDPASLAAGSGTFSGKTILDIALGNNNINNCGALSNRNNQKTDFSNRLVQDGATTGPYTGVQVYTFTPSGTVSHVRFRYTETAGVSIDSIVPMDAYDTRDNISTACKVKVYYRASLNSELAGTTRTTAYKLTLYAVYNTGAVYSSPANDRQLNLSVLLMDCASCGAYTDAAHTQWLTFMCHNLGANEALDPFTPSQYIHGAKYKWGVKVPALTQEEDQANAGSFSNWDSRGGTPPTTSGVDWDMATANPCPAGWRVPTIAEWKAVINTNNNTITKIGDWTGYTTNYNSVMKVGDFLFLPVAGDRGYYDGILHNRGSYGNYWSATSINARGYAMCFFLSGQNTGYDGIRTYGFSVRCIAENEK